MASRLPSRVGGCAPGSQSAVMGVPIDAELVTVGGTVVEGMGSDDVLGVIKAKPRPVVIEMREVIAAAAHHSSLVTIPWMSQLPPNQQRKVRAAREFSRALWFYSRKQRRKDDESF